MDYQERYFVDRSDAGRRLAERLKKLNLPRNTVVLGLPRGGIVVAAEVARALGFALDTFLVRKLGAPGHEELAIGALATGGFVLINRSLVDELQIPESQISAVIEQEQRELSRREQLYRSSRGALDVQGRPVVLVDDGLATGSTMLAAALALKEGKPGQVLIAVPVASREALAEIKEHADIVTCLMIPDPFLAVGRWYQDFSQTSDEQVRELLSGVERSPH